MSFFAGKTIVVTGSSGFIGHYVLSELRRQSCRVIRLGSHSYKPLELFSDLDVLDMVGPLGQVDTWQSVMETYKPEYVIHLAAQTSFYKAEEDPFGEYDCNVKPMLAMLEACKKSTICPAIVYTGTVSQYGLTDPLPVEPDRKDMPITLHDVHKIAAENYLKLYTSREYVRGTSLRLANVYGAPLALERNKDRGVINKIIQHALTGGDLQIYGDGSYVRDYVHVRDVACAILSALTSIEYVQGRHWAIGGGKGYTLNDLFSLIVKNVETHLGEVVSMRHITEPDGMLEIERRNFVANTDAFCKLTGWSPKISFDEGIAQTVGHWASLINQ